MKPRLYARAKWHEDDGAALWWTFPGREVHNSRAADEPPYVGTPHDGRFPECATHWQRIVKPAPPLVFEVGEAIRYKCAHDGGGSSETPCVRGCNAQRLRTMSEWRAATVAWRESGRNPALRPVYDPADCSRCGKPTFESATMPAFTRFDLGLLCACPEAASSSGAAGELEQLRRAAREYLEAFDVLGHPKYAEYDGSMYEAAMVDTARKRLRSLVEVD